jgi:hypothetical protein
MDQKNRQLNDQLPLFNSELREQIETGLKRECAIEFIVSNKDWDILRTILLRFLLNFNDWHGYLNKGQHREILAIKTKAGKLLDALSRAKENDLEWVLEYALTPNSVSDLLAPLEALSQMIPRTPKTDSNAKRAGQNFQLGLKAELQKQLDAWWTRVVGTNPEVEEGVVKPFSYFLAQIFKTLPTKVAKELGSSRTAVEGRRKTTKRRTEMLIKLGEKLANLQREAEPKSN